MNDIERAFERIDNYVRATSIRLRELKCELEELGVEDGRYKDGDKTEVHSDSS